jgi:hypothetical protein
VREQLSIGGLSRIARDLAGQIDEADTVARTAELAFDLIACVAADVVRFRHAGPPAVVASTDRLRSERTVGLCDGVDPALLCRPLRCPDQLIDAGRDHHGSYSGPGLHPLGGWVLRFHGGDSTRWSPTEVQLATAFADLAAVAIDRAALREQTQSLAIGLESNRLIGTAIGIVMANRRTTYGVAFDMLKTCSQHTNRKLRQIADEVVLTGELPAHTGRGVA